MSSIIRCFVYIEQLNSKFRLILNFINTYHCFITLLLILQTPAKFQKIWSEELISAGASARDPVDHWYEQSEEYLIMNLNQFQINSIFFSFRFPLYKLHGLICRIRTTEFSGTEKSPESHSSDTDSEDLLHMNL